MAAELDAEYPYRHSIVQELFIKTADDNYVAARWCFTYGLDVDFFWLAVHALEKYLKAALLLNGRSARSYSTSGKEKTYGHDIVRLYADVQPLAPELLPTKLTCPAEISDPQWYEEPSECFIARLYDMGHAHNRYQLSGYIRREEDLLKLDQMVFAVRRLCQPLETHFLGKKRSGVPDETRRQRILKDHPSSANLYSRLEETFGGKRGKMVRHAALNWNFPFAPKGYKHTKMRYGTFSAVNPVLVRRILDPLDAGRPDQDKQADELWKWVRENIHLPREFIDAYGKARVQRKAAAKKLKK
jgi:hypothetical protein